MFKRFKAWWYEINQAGKIMDAYVDDATGVIEPGNNSRSSASQRKAWTEAADWALTKVDD